MPDFSLIIPTYNERDQVGPLVEQVFAACAASYLRPEVIIVDDNSPDGTGACAARLAERWPVRVVHRPGKLGLGSAVLDGCAVADSDVIGVMDADFSHPPQLLPSLFATLSRLKVDMVVASRYIPGGGTNGWPLSRRIMSRVACWAARPLTPVRDPMSGYFLIRRERVTALRTRASGFKIGLEFLVRTTPKSVAELPYVFANRLAGRSKMGLREVLRYARQLLSLALYRFTHPIAHSTTAATTPSFRRHAAPRTLSEGSPFWRSLKSEVRSVK
jgi:dolichol-phosphate mannosyltransferase